MILFKNFNFESDNIKYFMFGGFGYGVFGFDFEKGGGNYEYRV